MKIGDIIARKDMPRIRYRIVGDAKEWADFWAVELLGNSRGLMQAGIIAKDDERWDVQEEELLGEKMK